MQIKSQLSRRDALSWLGTGGITTALVVGANELVRSDNVPKIIQAWADAQNTNNPVALAALYTEDAILEDVPNEFKIQGRNSIQCFIQSTQEIFTNIKIELQFTFRGENRAFAEYLFSATNNGFIPVPSTLGKSFTVRASTIFDLKGNKIQRSADYYDRVAILVQLGLISPPPAPTLPTNCTSLPS